MNVIILLLYKIKRLLFSYKFNYNSYRKMCKCLPRSTVIMLGLLLSLLVGIIAVSPIFFSGFSYRYTDLKWMDEGPYGPIAATEVASVVVLFVSFLLGVLTFGACPQSKTLQLFFVMFGLLSTILTFAIGVYTLVASQIKDNNLTQTCQKEHNGMFQNYMYLDEVFHKADELLCSSKCACNLTDELALEEFQQTEKYYYQSFEYSKNISTEPSNETYVNNVQSCKDISFITQLFQDKNSSLYKNVGDFSSDFKKSFATYWKRIEEKFDCVGWCEGGYTDESGKERYMYKYLFSDINRGVPKRRCMNPFKNWMVRMLKAFGSLMVIDSFFQGIVWVLAVTLFCNAAADDDSKRRPGVADEEKGKMNNKPEEQKV